MQILPTGRLVHLVYVEPQDTVAYVGFCHWLVPESNDRYLLFSNLDKPGKPMHFRRQGDTLVIDGPLELGGPDCQWIAQLIDPTQLAAWFAPTVAHHHTRMDQQEARAIATPQP